MARIIGEDEVQLFSGATEFEALEDRFDMLGKDLCDGDEASITLAKCEKYIVSPYNVLLKVIGWRKFQSRMEKSPCYIKCLNNGYPIFVTVMLIFACIAQVATCFHRSRSTPPVKVSDDYYVLGCERHQFTYNIISYIMSLISYGLAFYTFRIAEPEHLSSLMERVFLGFNDVHISKSRRRPFFILLFILMCGIVFFLISTGISITRLFALRLNDCNTIIGWFTSNVTAQNQEMLLKIDQSQYCVIHYFLVVFALLGFLFFDLLFIAVTINYCCQCQLLTFYIENIQNKVRNKKYKNLHLASKEIYRVYDFLKILNGNTSTVASLVLYIFLSNLTVSYRDLIRPDQEDLNIAVGFLNSFQWLVATLFPIFWAVRLTAVGNELRRLGIEIASRPFYYVETPDLELQFFLNFTESTRYEVNLAFLPMQPSLVLGLGFLLLLFVSSGVIISQVQSVTWF